MWAIQECVCPLGCLWQVPHHQCGAWCEGITPAKEPLAMFSANLLENAGDFGIAVSTRPVVEEQSNKANGATTAKRIKKVWHVSFTVELIFIYFCKPHGMLTRKQSRPKRVDVAHPRNSKRRDFFPWLFRSKRWWCGTSGIHRNSSQERTFHSTCGTCGGDTSCTDALSCTRGHHRKLDRVQDGVTWSKVADTTCSYYYIIHIHWTLSYRYDVSVDILIMIARTQCVFEVRLLCAKCIASWGFFWHLSFHRPERLPWNRLRNFTCT